MRSHVRDYERVCGFPPKDVLPLPYLHMLAFPLHMAVMTDADFPFPAMGTVHLENTITQHRHATADERFDVSVSATEPARTRQGPGVRHGHRGPGRRRAGLGRGLDVPAPRPGDESAAAGPGARRGRRRRCRLAPPGDLGRRYASVSGDYNPIHLYGLTAKALRLPSADRARHVEQGALRRGTGEPAARGRPGRGGLQDPDPAARDGALREPGVGRRARSSRW